MPELRPFRGFTFDPGRADPDTLLAPPAAQIPAPRGEHGGEEPGVRHFLFPPRGERSGHAAALAAEWRRSGVLRRSEDPCWYLLSQSFRTPAGLIERAGIVALCRLGPAGSAWITTFQRTHPPLLEAAVQRLRITRMHTEPIVLLDPRAAALIAGAAAAVRGHPPLLEALFDHAIHRLWQVTDGDLPDLSPAGAENGVPFLASGHHLYQAAQTFRDMMRLERRGAPAPWDYIPACLFPPDGSAVRLRSSVILLRRRTPPDWDDVALRFARRFTVSAMPSAAVLRDAVAAEQSFACGVFGNDRQLLLTPASEGSPRAAGDPLLPADLRGMDHHVVHREVLPVLEDAGAGTAPVPPEPRWIGSVEEAEAECARRKTDVGVLLRPPSLEDLERTGRNRVLLPPLSVSIGPEVPSGFIMSGMDDWVP